MKKRVLTLLLASAMLFNVAACGKTNGNEKLTKWLETSEVQEQIDGLSNMINGLDITMKAEGDDVLVISYKFEEQIDDVTDEQREQVQTLCDSQKASFEPMFKEVEKETEVKLSKIRMEFVNADGKEIYSLDLENK